MSVLNDMIMVARDRTYSELKVQLEGKKVVIWTCNTCARLCNGIGGDEAALNLRTALEHDGIEVFGILSTSAACLKSKVRKAEDRSVLNKGDILLSLTCDMGSLCAEEIFQMKAINPLISIGYGYVEEDRSLTVIAEGEQRDLRKEAESRGFYLDPFIEPTRPVDS
jgi:hypothetical protein